MLSEIILNHFEIKKFIFYLLTFQAFFFKRLTVKLFLNKLLKMEINTQASCSTKKYLK